MSALRSVLARFDLARTGRPWVAVAGYLLLAAAIYLVNYVILMRLGSEVFITMLAVVLGIIIYAAVSFRNLSVPFLIVLLSVGGFKFLLTVRTPFLPDLYFDRLMLMWLFVIFMLKFFAERRSLRGPFVLDIMIVLHFVYTLTQVIQHDMQFFNVWVSSILIPYTVYFMAKNIITSKQAVRTMFWFLLALSIYYNVTSVAEKYSVSWLIWPKYIITQATRSFIGRSQGPFMQAPLFGTVIGMLLPLHLYFIATVQSNWKRILLVVSLGVGLAGLYFTYTRGSWVTGLVALLVTVALNRKAYFRYLLPVLIVMPIIAVGLLGVAQDKFLQERVQNDDTIGSRVGTAVTVFRVWRDYPLFGVGFFQYRNIRDNYIQPVDVPGLPVIRFVQFRHNAIHDIYLGPLAETGIIGTSLQFAIYFLIIRAFLRKYQRRSEDDHFSTYALPVFGGIMMGYLIGGLAFDYRFFSVVPTLFLTCAGVLDGDLSEMKNSSTVDHGVILGSHDRNLSQKFDRFGSEVEL